MPWTMSQMFWVRSAGFPCRAAADLSEPGDVVPLKSWLTQDEETSTPRLRVGVAPSEEGWREIEDTLLQNVRRNLTTALRDENFQEAVFLSNREASERIRALAAGDWSAKPKRLRERTRLAWMYLQRFCTKNDTSSFYGPLAWGEVTDSRNRLEVGQTEGGWLRRREIFLEHWAVKALADAVSDDPEVRPHLPIHLNPACKIEGGFISLPINRRVTLRGAALALLSRFEGTQGRLRHTEPELMEWATREAGLDAARARSTLEELLRSKVLIRRVVIPTVDMRPERWLARALSELAEDCARRAHWLGLLDEIEALRQRLQQSSTGERASLSCDMQRLFESVVGAEALRRRSGEAYTGRYVFYEEAERALRFYLGEGLCEEIAPVLELILEAYRWVSIRAAALLHEHYLKLYQSLVNHGARSVDFLRFYAEAARLDHAPLITELKEAIRVAWAAAGRPPEMLEWRLTREALGGVVSKLKTEDADGVALCLTRVHSPDILLAAESLGALKLGRYQAVIGEMHPSVHTVAQPVALPFCPDPERLREEVNGLLSPHALVLADPSSSFQRSDINWPDCESLFEVVFEGGASRLPEARQVPIAYGEVSAEGGRLYFRDARSGKRCDLLLTMPSAFHKLLFEVSPFVLGADAGCRITCEKVVLRRRSEVVKYSGTFGPSGQAPDGAGDFSKMMRWAASRGLSRYGFFRVPGEPKPVFVDFLNPLAVDFFARSLARAGEASISEMLPGPEDLWLEDARGSYTCELRTTWTWRENDPAG